MRGGRGGRGGFSRAGRQVGAAMLRNQLVKTLQTNSTRRLQKDYQELKNAQVPLVGVSAAPTENDFFVWCANIRGPETSAFYGGVFHLEITFPRNYPCSPPSIRMYTPIPHPNVFGSSVCLDMLQPKNKDSGWYDGWSSAYTVESILIQLQSFLFEVPRIQRDILDKTGAGESISEISVGIPTLNAGEANNKYKKAVNDANAFKCTTCRHRGPIEPFPAFNEREVEEDAFVQLRNAKDLLKDEFLCYHSRNKLPEVALGIGVSMSRLPRTGEIRSVTPTLDLLSLRAFTKQKVRRSIDNVRFTHWLPLYFGESQPYDTTIEIQDPRTKEFSQESKRIDPRQRLITLLKHSLSFIAKGNAHKELNADTILEIMPKLIITHMVEMANERKHISILALRRLINFIRLFRLCIELVPEVMTVINAKIEMFKDEEEKRVKDFTPSLGDILAMCIVSDQYSLMDILQAYLEEQLDRQAFWIIRVVPELDHTDDKYKNKAVTLEDAREEVCFKTGQAGFQITMLFFSLTQLLQDKFGGDWQAFEGAVDDNVGCLDLSMENELQAKFKAIQKVDNFQKYYQMVGQQCPDSEALRKRLHKAISNSKAKRYHGSSEHMNELPKLPEQSKDYLMSEPSPFIHFNEEAKTFLDGANPIWKKLCMQKFNWVMRAVEQGIDEVTPASLASMQDFVQIKDEHSRSLEQHILLKQQDRFQQVAAEEKVFEDYPESFSWRDLFHKLCFEDMIQNFDKVLDFKVFYDFVNKIGSQQQVLRARIIKKTALKSNHYWIMVLLSKLTNLRVLKIHGQAQAYASNDFFKFVQKGMNYMAKEGRGLQKICMNNMLGKTVSSDDYLYPCLKPNCELIALDFSNSCLQDDDAKGIGKVLADFRNIREINLCNAGLSAKTTKDIADGLMRAKQLEILKLADNTEMGASLGTIIYNLAFSPKIRFINICGTGKGSSDIAEAIYKLVKISGAIETLLMGNTGLSQYLSIDFYVAVGENKTLKYIDLDTSSSATITNQQLLGRAIAMNAFRNGALVSISVANWFCTSTSFFSFIKSLMISNQDHEQWYGDKKLAKEMEKEDLVKHMYCNLKFLNLAKSLLGKFSINYKTIKKQAKPEWPAILELVTKTALTLNMKNCSLKIKDAETLAYMLADNPFGESKIESLQLQQNQIQKDGAKILAPALKVNTSVRFLSLDSCKLGVSGMKSICGALKTNSTIKSLSLYRNIFDVDGARALGEALKSNSSLSFIDIGHNRIRMTGLKSIVEGILANPASLISELAVKWNFITDEGFTYLFEQLVLPKQGRSQQLKKLWIKNNFLSEYHKVELNKSLTAANLTGQVYVDDFEGVNLLAKEFIDRSIWIAPMPSSMTKLKRDTVAHFFQEQHECGFVVDVRMGSGRAVPGRTRENHYCVVEYAHANSVPRSLKLASKKLAKFQGQPVRIYKAGTKTAVNFPSQRRRGF